jgi:hypothetical protein
MTASVAVCGARTGLRLEVLELLVRRQHLVDIRLHHSLHLIQLRLHARKLVHLRYVVVPASHRHKQNIILKGFRRVTSVPRSGVRNMLERVRVARQSMVRTLTRMADRAAEGRWAQMRAPSS